MKKCEFCAEEIQEQAIKCKHCGTNIQSSKLNNDTSVIKQNDQNNKVLVLIGLGIVIVVAIAARAWYMAIPFIFLWYIWQKSKWSEKNKNNWTAVAILSFFVLFLLNSYLNSSPKITVIEPLYNSLLNQSKVTLRGVVSPKKSTLNIQGNLVELSDKGAFSYDWVLLDEKNTLDLSANTGDKKTDISWVVNRKMSEEELKLAESEKKKIQDEKQKQEDVEFINQLNKDIESLKSFDGTKLRDSIDSILAEAIGFRIFNDRINRASTSSNQVIIKLGKQLKNRIIQIQSTAFPVLRSNYGKISGEKLWIDNGEVNVSGSGNKTITFVLAAFASNKNISQFHSNIEETLKTLRFTRVNYKWYSGASEYTYFNIDSLKDGIVEGVK